MNCLFCDIVKGELPAKIVESTDDILAFEDIAPQAPVHLLIIPRCHITTLNEIEHHDTMLLGNMVQVAITLAKRHDLNKSGYRLVWNTNAQGGQAVYHIHLHLLGGRQMSWPPG